VPKIAILILCHRVASAQLLARLFDDRFITIVHVDAKVDLEETPLSLPDNARFTEQRFPIFWGGFNMVRAAREMIRTARDAVPDLQRYVLISGDALPVVPLDDLVAKLLDESVEYIGLAPIANDPTLRNATHEEALQRYNCLQPWRFQNFALWDQIVTCPRTTEAMAKEYGMDLEQARQLRSGIHFQVTQPLLRPLPPRPHLFRNFYYGSQWWALGSSVMELIYEDMFAKETEEFFQFMEIPDEHFFQCLVGRYKSFLERSGRRTEWSFMYVDHDDPVRHQGGDDALESDRFFSCHARYRALFARKFDPARANEVREALVAGRYFDLLGGEQHRLVR
jgi:hypothetical protein